jgi:hypothetical protein
VLLLDEVSLFIGTDFERLTELQTLAEKVDEIGDGDIQLVVTAQDKIEDVQPKFAARGADFSILKDRFPHRYQLPSKHVGDIAKQRLFRKTTDGEQAVRDILEDATVKPAESLVFSEVKLNTTPPLDSINEDELVACYPFLPYHAPLFLEILFNLRKEATDPAKSIFSGTARAILALMHGLQVDWIDSGRDDQLVSLVDFYDLVKPEFREILTKDVRVIEGAEDSNGVRGIADEVDDGHLDEFDLDVAKAVLLLQHVHESVPMNEGNIAVAVMSDLNGQSWISTRNRVEESLDRMEKYIRPTTDETGPRYRFATQEERLIYQGAEEKESTPEWDGIIAAVDDHLWETLVDDLSLPESVPYGESGEEYPVSYHFSIDGTSFETTLEQDGGLDVHIEVQGLDPGTNSDQTAGETLYWEIGTEGIDDLRNRLVEWWALRAAVESHNAPPAVEQDLTDRAAAVRSKISSAMSNGSYTVKDRPDIGALSTAVETAVDVKYPDDFHPMMLQVNEDRLQDLAELGGNDPLPGWAQTIQVPTDDDVTDTGSKSIQNNVHVLAGRQLKDEPDGLTLDTVLDGIAAEKEYYGDVRPALRAILWGFCRQGRLLPIDESGNTLENEVVLTGDRPSQTRLKLLEVSDPGDILEEHGFKETTETVAEGLINVQRANERLKSRIGGIKEDVELVIDTDIHSAAVSELLESFAGELTDRMNETDDRLATIKAQDEGFEEAITGTEAAQEWYDEAADVWNRRLETIYRWDAQLTIGDGRFEWVDEDASEAIDARRSTIADCTQPWWTTDGWGTLVEDVGQDPTAALESAWESFVESHGLRKTIERADANPWVRPATELPAAVERGFERTFIAPARNLQRWYGTLDNAIASLSGDDHEAAIGYADDVAEMEPLATTMDTDIEDVRARLETLSDFVGDRGPGDVAQIGVAPDDRDAIDRRLAQIVEAGEVDIEASDEGVIVR